VLPIVICSTLSFVGGALILAIPLLGVEVGVTNPGIFYLGSAVLGVLARLATGRLSDRLGRATIAIPGQLLMTVVIVALVATADLGTVAFVVTGAFHGFAAAAILPAVQALVLDRSPAGRRGSSSAAMGMAFDVGFGTGSILIGAVASMASPSAALLATAAMPLISVGLLGIDARREARAA
jgi:predicted MFS family arabinose efflux permease